MIFYGLSDKGMVRESNQDAFLIDCQEEKGLAFVAVCDGMGGVTGGEIASAIAVDAFKDNIGSLETGSLKSKNRREILLKNTVKKANEQIFEEALNNPKIFGMGTTFVAAVCHGSSVTIANVGDSRAYLIDEDKITQITKDHSLVNEMLENGEISKREATLHPNKNVITRALGVDTKVECDIFNITVKKGQYILFCSDGLTNEVSDLEIHFEICNENTVEGACRSLTEIAKAHGGHDNITVVIGAF